MSLSICGEWTTVSRNLHRFGSFVNIAQKFAVAKDVACGLVIEKYHAAKIVSWCGVSVKCKWILCSTYTFIIRFFVCTLFYVGELDRFIFLKASFLPWLVFNNLVFFVICVIIIDDRFGAVRFNVYFFFTVVADCFLFLPSGSLCCFGVPFLRESHSWNFR